MVAVQTVRPPTPAHHWGTETETEITPLQMLHDTSSPLSVRRQEKMPKKTRPMLQALVSSATHSNTSGLPPHCCAASY